MTLSRIQYEDETNINFLTIRGTREPVLVDNLRHEKTQVRPQPGRGKDILILVGRAKVTVIHNKPEL